MVKKIAASKNRPTLHSAAMFTAYTIILGAVLMDINSCNDQHLP